MIVVHWLLAKRAVKKAKVMHEYKAENPDELTLEVDQIIEILKQVCSAVFVAVCASCILLIKCSGIASMEQMEQLLPPECQQPLM